MPRLSARNLAHHFAETDKEGTSASAMSISGPTLFSYAEPIAKKSPVRQVAWVTSRKFSPTTSKHTTWAHGALAMAGFAIVTSPDVPTSQADWDKLLEEQFHHENVLEVP